MSTLKVVGYALGVLIGWWVINVTVMHWWAVTTAASETMGLIEFFAREALREVPKVVYFLVAGAFLSRTLGIVLGAASAFLAALADVCINVALRTHMFLAGISYVEITILLINYGLPIAAAVVGALLIRRGTKGAPAET